MSNKIKEVLFLSLFITIGFVLLYFGLRGTHQSNLKSKSYFLVEGSFIGTKPYSDGGTHRLVYSYVIEGKQYTISTNYGTNSIPELGTKKTIKYNPSNPSEAFITGFSEYGLLIVLAIMFITIPSNLILSIILASKEDIKPKTQEKFQSFFIGMTFLVLGASFYYLMCQGSDTLSLVYALKTNGVWTFVPVLIGLAGLYIIISSFFNKNNRSNKVYLTNEDKNTKQGIKKWQLVGNRSNKLITIVNYIDSIGHIISYLISIILGIWLFTKSDGTLTRVVVLTILIICVNALFKSIIILVQLVMNFLGKNIDSFDSFIVISDKIHTIIFLTIWFGFLIVVDYFCLKQINEGGLILLLFTIIFWAVGIQMVRKKVLKNKK